MQKSRTQSLVESVTNFYRLPKLLSLCINMKRFLALIGYFLTRELRMRNTSYCG